MFVVFGVDPAKEIPKIRAEVPEASDDAIRAALMLCKDKPIQEYDTPDVANKYADMLRRAGWMHVSVKCQVLTPPAKRGGSPGKKWIYAHDLSLVDVGEQQRLSAWKDGSRFAARESA